MFTGKIILLLILKHKNKTNCSFALFFMLSFGICFFEKTNEPRRVLKPSQSGNQLTGSQMVAASAAEPSAKDTSHKEAMSEENPAVFVELKICTEIHFRVNNFFFKLEISVHKVTQ